IAFAVTFYVAAKAADADIGSRAAPSAPPAFLAPIGIAPTKIEVAPDGLEDWPRRIAVEAITSLHPLAPQRQEQADPALRRAGQKLLAVRDGASITSDVVRDALLDHGQLFSANPKMTPPDFFRTAAGRLEVHDDRSVFFPNDGSPPVRSTTPSASAPKPLTSEQV